MERAYGSQSMVEPLRRVLVRRPDAAFATPDYERWSYVAQPQLQEAQAEHDGLVATLREAGAEVVYHEAELADHADAVFVHDPVLVCDRGAIVLSMGKQLRRGEEDAIATTLEQEGVPVCFRLHGEARAEGGDLLWLDHQTLIAGNGFRTNRAGVEQLRDFLGELGVEVIDFDLPYFFGPRTCLHLMSFISLVDHDLAVVYPTLMPVALWHLLGDRGIEMIEVPEEEFLTMGSNVLALAPRSCLMLEDNPGTRERLEEAGCQVRTYRGQELSLKAEGGATCLTRPILRG
jgi:N-dimethylarginine dimethylaminohydrolase